MAYLLDTNALSEIDKPRPNRSFLQWFNQVPALELYVSCISVGELYKGVQLQPDGIKQRKLMARTEEIVAAFDNHVLSIDQSATRLWGELMAQGQQKGTTAPAIDVLIATQCLQYQLTLVTRNVKDFEQFSGLQMLSPWSKK